MPLFVIIGWDMPDSREKRPTARPHHRAHWADWDEEHIVIAGPMTDFAGSLFVVDAESQAVVEAKVAADPYLALKVWSRAEVHPFTAVAPHKKYPVG
ncbi:hypothetical protein BH09SUM1_BH09SUM1_27060 [soil metagenome]